jgi:hypothetical protein
MSDDEFDPAIERLFARTPTMVDAPLFSAQVDRRLQKGSTVRGAALALAALVGGAVAVRETLSVDIQSDKSVIAGDALGQGVRAVSLNAEASLQAALDQFGLAGLELGSMSGMQLFWMAAGALIAVAAAGLVRLSQEV